MVKPLIFFGNNVKKDLIEQMSSYSDSIIEPENTHLPFLHLQEEFQVSEGGHFSGIYFCF
jgi:hypothetical protein